jgi:hypothetical protein
MDSGVLGLGAVAWADAWSAAAPEPGLRLPVDPARLLDLLRGLPIARTLLSDLQRAAAAGRSVELFVSPDRQVVEVATGSGHHVLTVPARNSVLAALLGRSLSASVAPRAGSAPVQDRSAADGGGIEPSRPPPAPGILWQAPKAAPAERAPAESIALPWLGPDARLEVRREGAGNRPDPQDGSEVVCATLRLQLPHLGRFDAHIRLCGSTVAVSVDCASDRVVEEHLADLRQRLVARGLASAHVGLLPARSA